MHSSSKAWRSIARRTRTTVRLGVLRPDSGDQTSRPSSGISGPSRSSRRRQTVYRLLTLLTKLTIHLSAISSAAADFRIHNTSSGSADALMARLSRPKNQQDQQAENHNA